MLRNLQQDLKHLDQLAFRRSAHCTPLLKKFHALKKQIAATGHPDLIWNIYDWLLVPLSLWPLDFEGLSSHLLHTLTPTPTPAHPTDSSPPIKIQNSKFKNLPNPTFCLLHLIDPPPSAETQLVVASFEHDIESGRYEKMLKQAAKFDEQEKALLQNQQLAAEWAQLKSLFDIKQFQNSRGVIRRRMTQERGFRDPNWQFDQPPSSSARGEIENQSRRFHFFFDAFCYRWKLYGMEHDRPLLLKISVNPTPHGTMLVIPRHWSLDPRRDLDWSLINRLHRSRGAKKQGPKLSPARIQKLDEAKQVKMLRDQARKRGLRGDSLHEFICTAMKRDLRSDPSWWKRLLK